MKVGELKKLLDRCDGDFEVKILVRLSVDGNRPSYKQCEAEFADVNYGDNVFALSASLACFRCEGSGRLVRYGKKDLGEPHLVYSDCSCKGG